MPSGRLDGGARDGPPEHQGARGRRRVRQGASRRLRTSKRRNYEDPDLTLRPRLLGTFELETMLPDGGTSGVLATALGGFVGQNGRRGNPVQPSRSRWRTDGYEIREPGEGRGAGRDGVDDGAVRCCRRSWPAPPPPRRASPSRCRIEPLRPELLEEEIDHRPKVLAFGDPWPGSPRPARPSRGRCRPVHRGTRQALGQRQAQDRAAVEKYIKDFAAARGLTVTGPTALHDEWNLEDDPLITPLLEAHRTSVIQAKFRARRRHPAVLPVRSVVLLEGR